MTKYYKVSEELLKELVGHAIRMEFYNQSGRSECVVNACQILHDGPLTEPMTDEEIRKAFEEKFSYMNLKRMEVCTGMYDDIDSQEIWVGWQAAFEFMRKRNG